MNKQRTDRLGVIALDDFFSEHGWLFREQHIHDYGIDAHVEVVEQERPTGKLIAFQIKSGASFFKEETAKAFIFRTGERHLSYWLGHSMPVVLVLYHPETKRAFWVQIDRKTAKNVGTNWKISVPKDGMFDDPARTLRRLAALTQPEPYLRRLNRQESTGIGWIR